MRDKTAQARVAPTASEPGPVYQLPDGRKVQARFDDYPPRLWVLTAQGVYVPQAVGVLAAYELRIVDGSGLWDRLYWVQGGDLGPGWHLLRGGACALALTQLTLVAASEGLAAGDEATDETFLDLMAELEWEWQGYEKG